MRGLGGYAYPPLALDNPQDTYSSNRQREKLPVRYPYRNHMNMPANHYYGNNNGYQAPDNQEPPVDYNEFSNLLTQIFDSDKPGGSYWNRNYNSDFSQGQKNQKGIFYFPYSRYQPRRQNSNGWRKWKNGRLATEDLFGRRGRRGVAAGNKDGGQQTNTHVSKTESIDRYIQKLQDTRELIESLLQQNLKSKGETFSPARDTPKSTAQMHHYIQEMDQRELKAKLKNTIEKLNDMHYKHKLGKAKDLSTKSKSKSKSAINIAQKPTNLPKPFQSTPNSQDLRDIHSKSQTLSEGLKIANTPAENNRYQPQNGAQSDSLAFTSSDSENSLSDLKKENISANKSLLQNNSTLSTKSLSGNNVTQSELSNSNLINNILNSQSVGPKHSASDNQPEISTNHITDKNQENNQAMNEELKEDISSSSQEEIAVDAEDIVKDAPPGEETGNKSKRKRRKRHVGPHDEGGLQRLISTGKMFVTIQAYRNVRPYQRLVTVYRCSIFKQLDSPHLIINHKRNSHLIL